MFECKVESNKYGQHLSASVPLFSTQLSDIKLFCRKIHFRLSVWKRDGLIKAIVGIGDLDDYDYEREIDNLTPYEIHEIMNYMKDCQWAEISDYDEARNLINNIYEEITHFPSDMNRRPHKKIKFY